MKGDNPVEEFTKELWAYSTHGRNEAQAAGLEEEKQRRVTSIS